MNMSWKPAVALLVVAGLGVASANLPVDKNLEGCYPQWDVNFPRPDCSDCNSGQDAQKAWQCWNGMYYL